MIGEKSSQNIDFGRKPLTPLEELITRRSPLLDDKRQQNVSLATVEVSPTLTIKSGIDLNHME